MKILTAVLLGVAAALIPAQGIVWALSLYHINSGLAAPLIFVVALESIIAAGVLTAAYTLED